MSVFYVCGSVPGAGTTAICAAIAHIWSQSGKRVEVYKPLSLSNEKPDADAELLIEAAGLESRSSHTKTIQNNLSKQEFAKVVRVIKELNRTADLVLLDGLPLMDSNAVLLESAGSFVKDLGAQVLGVQPYSKDLDTILSPPWKEVFGDNFAGLFINRFKRYSESDVRQRLVPALHKNGLPVLGIFPEERFLLSPTVGQVAEHLNAQIITSPSKDERLVEQFILGGLILEWGGNYFDRYPNQAVIVRSGRTDIAMSALNFPMSCLILTSCSQPPQYVYQRASAQEVPLLTVEQSTLEIATLLDTVDRRVNIHHLGKIERFASVIYDLVDWAQINSKEIAS